MQQSTIASLMLFSALACAAQAPPETAPKVLPELFSPARNFDLQQLDAELRLDWRTQRLHGKVRLDLQAFRATDKVLLDAAELDIKKISDAEGRALRFQLNPDPVDGALSVDLSRAAAAGERIQLHIEYQSTHHNQSDPNALAGSNGKGLRFLQKSFTEPRRRTQAWVYSEMGGVRYWPYGVEQLAHVCRARRIPLALLPGDDQPDPELSERSTLPADAGHRLWQYGVQGGIENAQSLLAYAATLIGRDADWRESVALMRAGLYWPGRDRPGLDDLRREWLADAAVTPALVAVVCARADAP